MKLVELLMIICTSGSTGGLGHIEVGVRVLVGTGLPLPSLLPPPFPRSSLLIACCGTSGSGLRLHYTPDIVCVPETQKAECSPRPRAPLPVPAGIRPKGGSALAKSSCHGLSVWRPVLLHLASARKVCMTTKQSPPQRQYRDAGTGQYVPKREADRLPGKTVSEPRPPLKKK